MVIILLLKFKIKPQVVKLYRLNLYLYEILLQQSKVLSLKP